MTNHLLIGHADKTDRLLQLAKPPFLLIDDGPIADAFLDHFPKAKPFDISQHSFNPLRGMDYKRARDFAALIYALSPQGADTLTVRNGKRALVRLLLENPAYLDELPKGSDDASTEARGMVEELLVSPVLERVLCRPTNFSFKGSVVARINRAALGEFDALILGNLLLGQHKGQAIVPDFGFYGREFHVSLIRQNRLICGLNSLSEITDTLQQAVLGIQGKTVYRTTREDAKRLIDYINPTGNPKTLMELEGDDYRTSGGV